MTYFDNILKSDAIQKHPVCVHHGPEILKDLPSYLPGGLLLLLTSAGFTRRGLTRQVVEQLGKERVYIFDGVTPNPQLDDLDNWTEQLLGNKFAGILAIGGGSVLDSAKVLSVTLTCPFDRPLHELFRQSQSITWDTRLPLVAVPTTSGTGAEATPFATVWDSVTRKKYSLENDLLYPQLVLLDPVLTLGLPPEETYNTGLDTYSHALESLWNRHRSAASCSFSVEALERVVSALPRVLEESTSLPDRTRMQEASYLAGVAISYTRTAIAHAISYPLTLHYDMPHGIACGFTLPAILRYCSREEVDLGAPETLLQSAYKELSLLEPAQRALRYASSDQIQALCSEMMAPGRADNFILPVDEVLIQNILRATFQD